MAVEVLDVVAKDPKEKHIAGDVQDPGVQKHAGEQRQKRGLKRSVAGKPGGEAGGDSGVGGHEQLKGVGRQRVLVNKNEDVEEDERGVDDRVGAAGIQVFERNEHERESELQGTGNGQNCKELQGGASDNIVVAPTWLT